MKFHLLVPLLLSIVECQGPTEKLDRGVRAPRKPWMVYLEKPTHWCAGTLYTNSLVISAGHCVKDNIPEYKAYVNRYNKNLRPKDEPDTSIYNVLDAKIHPEFSMETRVYDISVWWIDSDSDERTIINLDKGKDFKDRTNNTFLLGWGDMKLTKYGGEGTYESANYLQEAVSPIADDDLCRQVYPAYFDPTSVLCSGDKENLITTCSYDSGGPLVRYRTVDDIVLIGVISYGLGCGIANSYNVLTKVSVSKIRVFINKYVEQFSPKNKVETTVKPVKSPSDNSNYNGTPPKVSPPLQESQPVPPRDIPSPITDKPNDLIATNRYPNHYDPFPLNPVINPGKYSPTPHHTCAISVSRYTDYDGTVYISTNNGPWVKEGSEPSPVFDNQDQKPSEYLIPDQSPQYYYSAPGSNPTYQIKTDDNSDNIVNPFPIFQTPFGRPSRNFFTTDFQPGGLGSGGFGFPTIQEPETKYRVIHTQQSPAYQVRYSSAPVTTNCRFFCDR